MLEPEKNFRLRTGFVKLMLLFTFIVAVLQNETFTKGFGKWKPTDSQPGWKTGNSSKGE